MSWCWSLARRQFEQRSCAILKIASFNRASCRPPNPTAANGRTARPDDWSEGAAISPPSSKLVATQCDDTGPEDDDSGVRRAPDLPVEVALTPEDVDVRKEFAFDEERSADEADDDAVRAKSLQTRFRTAARQAALDPGDGIEL